MYFRRFRGHPGGGRCHRWGPQRPGYTGQSQSEERGSRLREGENLPVLQVYDFPQLQQALYETSVDVVNVMERIVFTDFIRIYHSVLIRAGNCREWEVKYLYCISCIAGGAVSSFSVFSF